MSKSEIKQGNGRGAISWGNGYALSVESPDRINGQIFGIIEALGLSEKQEESAKNLIRRAVWDTFQEAVYLSAERYTELRELHFQKRREIAASDGPSPVAEI